ncbi:hypothetical protein PILCRDRAFT_825566 [Piloderma croceum F 1598]|uniref:Uncharacterized protein n=1 Tax=Piloderma croceum (strain F 1598) TaxID=765440 RepID=A0A0C3FBJ0_PILCF|nr:hypothetical protein PILCRDRAFT_825566 [Piloderma croceum F 1598]
MDYVGKWSSLLFRIPSPPLQTNVPLATAVPQTNLPSGTAHVNLSIRISVTILTRVNSIDHHCHFSVLLHIRKRHIQSDHNDSRACTNFLPCFHNTPLDPLPPPVLNSILKH